MHPSLRRAFLSAAVCFIFDVLVSSASVRQPAVVRYAWKDNPEEANLAGENGLPVGPFRIVLGR